MPRIILSTLNARYIHASMGLRYLYANMGQLQDSTEIVEFNINSRVIDIAESLLDKQPAIIGLGVYIWNATQSLQLVNLIKTISPETIIILGGPEVSYEYVQQEIVKNADYLISGSAEIAFKELCDDLLNKKIRLNKVIKAAPIDISGIKLPYTNYSDEDIRNRVIYVEASRGCPFKCEFCLSSLDKTVYPFDLDIFLNEMEILYQRGVRHFKFVDRTFNLKVTSNIRIMEFFLNKIDNENTEKLLLHFELIPDHLPEKLKSTISQFPNGSIQFEIGIQSLNAEVQTIISRKQNTEKVTNNLNWLRKHSNAHIHADLIIGLPGETIDSFATGLNQLYKMAPHEIQVGILKRLKGTPIIRHTEKYAMRYNPQPPFNILSNNLISFSQMQGLSRFARYWDLIINSGRFNHAKQRILADNPFYNFLTLSDWIFEHTGQTHKIALPRLFSLLYKGLIESIGLEADDVKEALLKDFEVSGIKGQPKFLQITSIKSLKKTPTSQRQIRHCL